MQFLAPQHSQALQYSQAPQHSRAPQHSLELRPSLCHQTLLHLLLVSHHFQHFPLLMDCLSLRPLCQGSLFQISQESYLFPICLEGYHPFPIPQEDPLLSHQLEGYRFLISQGGYQLFPIFQEGCREGFREDFPLFQQLPFQRFQGVLAPLPSQKVRPSASRLSREHQLPLIKLLSCKKSASLALLYSPLSFPSSLRVLASFPADYLFLFLAPQVSLFLLLPTSQRLAFRLRRGSFPACPFLLYPAFLGLLFPRPLFLLVSNTAL